MFQVDAAQHLRFANLPDVLTEYRWGPQSTSHGRDRIRELKGLLRHAFTGLGFGELTAEELRLHLITVKLFEQPLDPAAIRAFRAWLRALARRNTETGVFDPSVFQKRLEQAWEELFHFLPAFGAAPTWAYLREGGRITPGRLYYLLRSSMVPREHRIHPRS